MPEYLVATGLAGALPYPFNVTSDLDGSASLESERLGKKKVLSEGQLREMVTPGEGQMFGIVAQMLGYDRLMVKCADGHDRVCRIRGKMKRRVWIKVGDLVLVAPWDFQFESRGDILWRYTEAQAQILRSKGQLAM